MFKAARIENGSWYRYSWKQNNQHHCFIMLDKICLHPSNQWNKFIFIILMWLMQNNITHLSIILFYYFYFNLQVFPLLTDSKIVNLSIGECTCNKRRCVFELCAIWGGTVLQPCRTLLTWASFALVLCREAKTQVGSESGNFKHNRVGSVRVESCNLNKKFLKSFLPASLNADKSTDWTEFRSKTSP